MVRAIEGESPHSPLGDRSSQHQHDDPEAKLEEGKHKNYKDNSDQQVSISSSSWLCLPLCLCRADRMFPSQASVASLHYSLTPRHTQMPADALQSEPLCGRETKWCQNVAVLLSYFGAPNESWLLQASQGARRTHHDSRQHLQNRLNCCFPSRVSTLQFPLRRSCLT